MNHPNLRLIYLRIILIIVILCVLLASCDSTQHSSSRKEKNDKDYSKATLSEIEGAYDGTEDNSWLQAVQKTAQVMCDNHFTYNRKGIKNILDKALDGNRHGDCAHLISWSLQEYGVLEPGEHFYSASSGSLSCSRDSSPFAHLEEKCDIIDVEGISCSDVNKLKDTLHVGDICCYNLHMNVVAGINKKGDILYYDAGLVPTKKSKGKIYYTDKLSRPFSRKTVTFKKYKLYTIIRVKE